MGTNTGNNIELNTGHRILASSTGAILTSLFVTPFDVVKIRIQAQQKEFLKNKCFLYCNGLMEHICYCSNGNNQIGVNGNTNGHQGQNHYKIPEMKWGSTSWYKRPVYFTGTLDGIFKIARNEGVGSLWSGLPPTLIMAVPATAVYFTAYDQLRDYMNLVFGMGKTGFIQPFWIPMLAGATARTFAVTLISPLEMIRTKLQSEKISYVKIVDAVKKLVKSEGITSLWRGLGPTILRDVPFSAIYWGGYEFLKHDFQQKTPSFAFAFAAGATAGTLAAVVTLPFDVVKTHRQIELGQQMKDNNYSKKNRKTAFIMKDIYRIRGIPGLFAGLSPRIVKVAPACAIMISTYEYGKRFFRNYNAHL